MIKPKPIWAIIFSLCCCHYWQPVYSQDQSFAKIISLKTQLQEAGTDSAKNAVLFKIGNYYLERLRIDTRYLDSNFYNIDETLDLSRKLNYKRGIMESYTKKAYLYHLYHQMDKADKEATKLDDTAYIRYMIAVAYYYSTRRELKENYDTAVALYHKAIQRSENTGHHIKTGEIFYRLAGLAYSYKEYVKAKGYAGNGEAAYRKAGDIRRVGTMWNNLAFNQDTLNPNFTETKYGYRKAATAYREVKDTLAESIMYYRLGTLLENEGLLDSADLSLSNALALQKQVRYKKIYITCVELAYTNRFKGDFDQALYYALEAVKTAEEDKYPKIGWVHYVLGIVYNDLLEYKMSINAYTKGIASLKREGIKPFGAILKGMTKAMIMNGQPQQALDFLQDHTKDRKGEDRTDMMVIAESYGNCYMALQKPDLAEKYYIEMAGHAKSLHPSFAVSSDFSMGKFYYERGQYQKARIYLSAFLKNPQYVPPSVQSEAYMILFKTDSSAQQYESALEYFRKYKQQQDIVFSYHKSKQIAELQIKYDTEKKDRDLLLKDRAILLKEKDIEILTKQAFLQKMANERKNKNLLLKEQSISLLNQQAALNKINSAAKDNRLKLNKTNIELLTKQAELQKTELAQAKLLRQITIAGLVLLLVIIGLLYSQYRNKQKNGRAISLKNKVLESLMKEKEWLLKEIHHRVKNNLQTVVSLLESQSVYLKNDALLAIQDSQNRVHAMSLIHQTLYQGDNVSSINMSLYLPQMVNYLKEIFNVDNILFSVQIDPVELDVSQAVPVGLILNEAVTNAIKYAFDNHTINRQINVQMKQTDNNRISVSISDNGKGIKKSNTAGLGLQLMKSLAEDDMEGQFTLDTHHGTIITVVFVAGSICIKEKTAAA